MHTLLLRGALPCVSGLIEQPDPDEADLPTSKQPLGDLTVEVVYRPTRLGAVAVEHVIVEGGVVEADQFAASTIGRWERAIEKEIA